MIVVFGTIGVIFSIPGQTMGFSVFTDILMRELGLTRVQLSTAYCLGTVLSGLTLPLLGRLFDRIGARKMVVYTSIATGLILFYLSQTRNLLDGAKALLPGVSPLFLAFAIITVGFYLIRGSAQGVLTMTSRNVMGKWFDYHRGTALAVSGVFVSFAFSYAPRFLDQLILQTSWDRAWMILGILTLVGMTGMGWLFFRDNPEECGLVMDGPVPVRRKRVQHADSIAHRDYTRPEALRTLAFWAFNLSFTFYSLFGTACTFHIVSLGEEAARSRSEIIGFFLPMAVVSVLTNLLCGLLSSHMRLKYLLLMMNLAAIMAVLGTLRLESSAGAIFFIVGHGVCGGAFAALSGIVWPRFFGRRWLGSISGFGMSSMVIGSGVGPLVFSLSHHLTGRYDAILWMSLTIPIALGLMAFRADNPQRAETEAERPV